MPNLGYVWALQKGANMKLLYAAFLLHFGLMAQANTPKSKPKPVVFTQKLAPQAVKEMRVYPGVIKSRVEANIKADQDVIVVGAFAKLGQKVKKGDKLLELKNQDSSMVYQNRILRSPVDGVVAAILTQVGQFAQRGSELLLVNDPQNLYVKLEIPAINSSEITEGMLAIVKGSFLGTQNYEAKVIAKGSVVDSTGTISTEIQFLKPEALIPGVIVKVEIALKEQELILVPAKAIYYVGEKTFLPLIQNGKVKKVEVTVKKRNQGLVEITKGVTDGDMAVVGAGEYLKDGDAVEVKSYL
jgi:multidrug efflux pump subunit AcrA (membrane-fusion protein)